MNHAPLAGLRVVVTRAAAQAASTAAALTAAGAEVALLPLLEIVPPADPRPLDRAANELASYQWIVLTSVNGVAALVERIPANARIPARIAAVGPATAAALRRHGLVPDLIPDEHATAQGLLATLVPHARPGKRLLLAQAADARPELARGLAAAGFEVTTVVAYEKQLPPATPILTQSLFAAHPLGWVTFASASAARRFAALFGTDWPQRRSELRAASIGPATSMELRDLGVEPAAEAAAPTDDALVAAIAAKLAPPRPVG
jgi:uroporphyrinogen-III synthase